MLNMWSNLWLLLYYKLTAISFERISKIGTFGKIMGKKPDCIPCSLRSDTVLLKDKLAQDPTNGGQELLSMQISK